MSRRPISSSRRGRVGSRPKVGPGLPSRKAGQALRPGSRPQQSRLPIRPIELSGSGPKALAVPACSGPRESGPVHPGHGTLTTADDFYDFIIDGPVAPPGDEDLDDPVEL